MTSVKDLFRKSPRHYEVMQLQNAQKGKGKMPPTPVEIKERNPLGEEFSTLSRYVVKTEEKVASYKFASKQVEGLVYENVRGEEGVAFIVRHALSGKKVMEVKNVEGLPRLISLANRVFINTKFFLPEASLDKEQISYLVSRFYAHLVLDPETKKVKVK